MVVERVWGGDSDFFAKFIAGESMGDISRNNMEKDFDTNIYGKLKCYVYALRDPRDNKVFYVGKGGGQGNGNSRLFQHFTDAETALRNPEGTRSSKIQRIIEIWAADEIVDWFILRHGLDEPVAHHVEAALIDAFEVSQNGPVLNDVRGHGAAEHGLLMHEDVYSFAAQPVNPKTGYKSVFIFPIYKALQGGKIPYDATRCCWIVSQQFRSQMQSIAVGVSGGISKGAYEISRWFPSGNRWGFEGTEISGGDLFNVNFYPIISKAMGYFQRGNYLVVEFDGRNKFRFVRGSGNKDWQIL